MLTMKSKSTKTKVKQRKKSDLRLFIENEKSSGNGKEWKWHDEGEINWFPEDFAWQNYINPDMIEKEACTDQCDFITIHQYECVLT